MDDTEQDTARGERRTESLAALRQRVEELAAALARERQRAAAEHARAEAAEQAARTAYRLTWR